MRVIQCFIISAIVSLGTTHGAADDGTVNLIKIDGSCVKISKKAALYSSVLHDRILKYPAEHEVYYGARESESELVLLKEMLDLIDESAQNLAEAEQNLGDSMLPKVRKMYEENASATMRCYMESDAAFATLAGIAHAYKIPQLDEAVLQEFGTLIEAHNPKHIIQHREFLEQALQQMAHLRQHAQELTPLQREGMGYVGDLVKRAMISDKQKVLKEICARNESIQGPAIFFTGVSIGDLFEHAQITPEYVHSNDHEALCVIDWDGITSLEGLRFDCSDALLQKRKRLKIHKTGIDYLPADGFLHVHNPEKVILKNNAIKEMHVKAFVGLSALTVLNLSGNKIKRIPSGIFDGLLFLETVQLADNELVSFDVVELLRNNVCIKELGLSENKLEVIPTEWPSSCDGIKVLDFSNNRIQVIPSNLFIRFKKLRELSVDYNQIQEVQPVLFTGCENLKELYIRDNPISKEQMEQLDEELPKVSIY